MNGLDLIRRNIIWIILGSLFFYVVLILFSDASKISDHFIHIRIELIFLIFVVGILSHIIKSFRQKYFLQMVDIILFSVAVDVELETRNSVLSDPKSFQGCFKVVSAEDL